MADLCTLPRGVALEALDLPILQARYVTQQSKYVRICRKTFENVESVSGLVDVSLVVISWVQRTQLITTAGYVIVHSFRICLLMFVYRLTGADATAARCRARAPKKREKNGRVRPSICPARAAP